MKKQLLSLAMVGVVAATTQAMADAHAGKEKCYGIAAAGKNDCKSADGAHSCAGHAKVDKGANEWKFVEHGECVKAGGSLTPAKS